MCVLEVRESDFRNCAKCAESAQRRCHRKSPKVSALKARIDDSSGFVIIIGNYMSRAVRMMTHGSSS